MKVLLALPASALAIALAFGAVVAQEDAAMKELAKMQGVWQLLSGEEDGKPSSDHLVENLRLVFKGDQLTLQGVDLVMKRASKLTIKIDPSTTPKCIDFKVDAGSEKGTVLEAIYEWNGDDLKLCLFPAGGNRPLKFETKAGSNLVLFVLKRQKP